MSGTKNAIGTSDGKTVDSNTDLGDLNYTGWIERLFKSKKPTVGTMSTLSPEQETLMSELGNYLTNALTNYKGYEGQLTADPNAGQISAYEKALANLNSGLSSTAQASTGAYKDVLAGADPKTVYNQYMQYTAPLENAYLKNTLLPAIKEAQVPGGTLRSTGTENAIAKTVGDFGNQQLSRIGDRITSERANVTNALGQATSMDALEKQTGDIGTASYMGGVARAIEQEALTAKLQEYYRTNPEMASILSNLMSYMNIDTKAMYQTEGSASPFMQLLSGLGGAVGNYMGGG